MVLYYFKNNKEVDKNYFLYLKIEEREQKDYVLRHWEHKNYAKCNYKILFPANVMKHLKLI